MGTSDILNDLAGYLHVKHHYKGFKKLIPSRKRFWCVFDEHLMQLQFFKSSKDAFVKMPSGALDLHDAHFYFENAELFEFVINASGKEHFFKADSHDLMMDWLRRLRDKVYPDEALGTNLLEKRAKSLDFNTITDEETFFQKPAQLSMSLSDLNESPRRGHRRKRRVFLPWSFRWSSNSSSNVKEKQDGEVSTNGGEMRNSQSAADIATNIPSTRHSTASTKKLKCKSCAALSSRNDSLGSEVEKLTERIRALEEAARNNKEVIKSLKIENVSLKKDLVVITQEIVTQEEELDANLDYNRHCSKVLRMLESARATNQMLPDFKRSISTVYTDKLGFIHGERESPAQAFHFCCEQLKEYYTTEARGEDLDMNWKEFLNKSNDANWEYSKELMTLVVNGVPTVYRSELWKRLISSRVKSIKEVKGPDYYKELCKQVPSIDDTDNEFDDSIEKQIRIDLLRTMPSHVQFKTLESEGVLKLFRVLRAFLLHNPEIGYCQGMNFMVAMGLLHLSEENAFWLLVAITEVYFNKNHYNHYLTGSQADQKVLEELAAKKLPNIMQFSKETGCDISPVTFNWLMTLFIDSVPPEVGQRIWDCFFVEGHPVLYRFSLALLKLNEGGICTKTDMLAQMRYLKKIGRQIHDVDALLQLAYEGFEPFPSPDVLKKMYERHFCVIQKAHEQREKQDKEYESKRSRMLIQPKAINISLGVPLDNIPQDFTIECCTTEANANRVWLCCSTHHLGRLFVLDTVNRSLDALARDIKSRCLCLTRSKFSNAMIVGTADASLHGFDVETRKEIWSLPVDDSVSSISCDQSGTLFSTLASGSIAVAQENGDAAQPSKPVYLHIGSAPVVCGCICGSYFWCGCGNNIVILDTNTLDEVESIQVCPNLRHSIAKLIESDIGVWCSVRGSSVLQLFDKKNFSCLMTTDVMDESGLASEKISHLSSTRITALLPRKNEVWVGLGNGRFLIFEVKKGPKPVDETPQSEVAGLVESEVAVDWDEDDETQEKAIDQPMALTEADPPCCHVTLVRRNKTNASTFSLGNSEFVFVSRLSGSSEQLDGGDKFHIVLKQLQRVSEDAVHCLACVRNDYKLILSCAGAINNEMSTVLWSCERRQGKEMWYAQTITFEHSDESAE